MECRKQKAMQWQIRLTEEIKRNKHAKAITLTFSNEHITKLYNEFPNITGYPLDNHIAKIAVRRFLERYRKKYKTSIRHWFVTELGHNGTENIHLHGILWTTTNGDEIEKLWQYGFIWRGYTTESKINGWGIRNYVNGNTITYMTKYILKQDEKHKNYQSKILTSPGIGSGYENSYNAKKNLYMETKTTNETYRTETGYRLSLPIYYRNKLYSEEQREKLWLQKLDKNERWICGIKVRADDSKTILKLLKEMRRKNKELGYGDDTKNWNEELYEQERRKLLIQKRKDNASGGDFSRILDI